MIMNKNTLLKYFKFIQNEGGGNMVWRKRMFFMKASFKQYKHNLVTGTNHLFLMIYITKS